uniref:Structural constituent of ribosome protein n=1 Tax=Rhizophora mucronata TaxID=61149 RepID=A0A2P2KV46_RHIMU
MISSFSSSNCSSSEPFPTERLRSNSSNLSWFFAKITLTSRGLLGLATKTCKHKRTYLDNTLLCFSSPEYVIHLMKLVWKAISTHKNRHYPYAGLRLISSKPGQTLEQLKVKQ